MCQKTIERLTLKQLIIKIIKFIFNLSLILCLYSTSWGILDYYKTIFYHFNTTNQLAKWTDGDPQRLAWWIENNIYYKEDVDKTDEWINPQNTFAMRYGDCEEFATLPYYIMSKWDCMTTKYIISFKGEKSHVVLFYKFNDKWFIMSNGKITKCQNEYLFNNILDYMKKGYSDYFFKDINGDKLDWRLSREALQAG